MYDGGGLGRRRSRSSSPPTRWPTEGTPASADTPTGSFTGTINWVQPDVGADTKIRLISHRSFGFHSAQALIALVYLCCSGTVIELPR